jgi:RES domain-containing protein
VNVWRLCEARYCEGALSGEGAFRYPGRWNLYGVAVVYTVSSPSLAMLEYLINVDREDAPANMMMVRLAIPGTAKLTPDARLPSDWDAVPVPSSTQEFGSAWVRRKSSLALGVPSVVQPSRAEYCVLLNPLHPQASRIRRVQATPFSFDERLLN